MAHEGPHVVYSDGVLFAWLKERRLLGTMAKVPLGALRRFSFHHRGRLRMGPPRSMLRTLLGRRRAPVERSYQDWATERFGAEAAEVSAAATGVGVFHADPGSLSAAFVYERLRRVFSFPPAASYRRGGGGAMIADVADYARSWERGSSWDRGSMTSGTSTAGRSSWPPNSKPPVDSSATRRWTGRPGALPCSIWVFGSSDGTPS